MPAMASFHSNPEVADVDVEEQRSILHHALSSDFQFVRVLAHGSQGSVFAVRCTLGGLPPNKLYALKLFYHYKRSWSSAAFRSTGGRSPIPAIDDISRPTYIREHEWVKRSRVLRHKNVVGILTWFEDIIEDELWEQLPEHVKGAIDKSASARSGRRAQFVLFDLHEQTVADYVKSRGDRPVPYAQAKKWSMQLVDAVCFLKDKGIVHCDLKLEHLLLNSNGDIVLAGIGREKYLDLENDLQYFSYGLDNTQHAAPEVHRQSYCRGWSVGGGCSWTEYDRQTGWTVGVLIYEFVMKAHPLPDYPGAYRNGHEVMYNMEHVDIKPLPSEYVTEFNTLVMTLLEPDPDKRPILTDTRLCLEALHTGSADHLLQEVPRAHQEHEQLKESTSKLREEKCVLENRLHGYDSDERELKERLRVLEEAIAKLEEQSANLNVLLWKHERTPLVTVVQEIAERRSKLRERLTALNTEDTQDVASTWLLCSDVETLLKVMETAMARVNELHVLRERLPIPSFHDYARGLNSCSSRGVSRPIPAWWKTRQNRQTAASHDVTIDKDKLEAIRIAFAELQTVRKECVKQQDEVHQLRKENAMLSVRCKRTETACQTLRAKIGRAEERVSADERHVAKLHARLAEYDERPLHVLSRDAAVMRSDLSQLWSTPGETNVQAHHELEDVYRLYDLCKSLGLDFDLSYQGRHEWSKHVDRLDSLVKTSRQQLEIWNSEMVQILEVLTEMSTSVAESASRSQPKPTGPSTASPAAATEAPAAPATAAASTTAVAAETAAATLAPATAAAATARATAASAAPPTAPAAPVAAVVPGTVTAPAKERLAALLRSMDGDTSQTTPAAASDWCVYL
ncbi:uncharacterized protein LOC135811806 [Sycon ciliatum]|uniref:uncharacterized protein LOC135811806 n=1 Tax=Sycon ciliatum TaxID=27933 RepID=UPI0031F6EE04